MKAEEARKLVEQSFPSWSECSEEIVGQIIKAAKAGETDTRVSERLMRSDGTKKELERLGYKVSYELGQGWVIDWSE